MTAVDGVTADRASEIVAGDVPGGPSTSQTIMVASLIRLLELVPAEAPTEAYRAAIRDENVLGKETAGAREWAFRQLRRFYLLSPDSLLFRALRDLWPHESAGQALLALSCALARDPVLRASAPMVLGTELDGAVTSGDFELVIEESFPGVYAASTRRTTSQKLASSWNQSGHLRAVRGGKVRVRATCRSVNVAYALLLGHLQGVRGQALFDTLWSRVLDQPTSHLVDLAASASQQGLLEFRNAGGVVEVTFAELLRPFGDGSQGELL